jgi:hypothetical protein
MRLSALFFVTISLAACSKKTTVEGIVQENNTGKPIPFAQVFLEEEITATRQDRRQTVTADANGIYKINFSAKHNTKYGIDGVADKCTNVAQFQPVTNGKANTVNLTLQTEAFIKVHAVRTSTSDTLWLGWSIRPNDTTYVYPVKGNQDDFLIYLIKSGGTFIKHEVPFNIPAFQTKDFLLQY